MALLCLASSSVALRGVLLKITNNPKLSLSADEQRENNEELYKSVTEINEFLKAIEAIKYTGGPGG
jgi:hypothetical protein